MRHTLLITPLLLAACSSDKPPPDAAATTPTVTVDPVDDSDSSGDSSSPADSADSSDSGGPEDPRMALFIAEPAHAETARVTTPDRCAECHSNASGADAMRLSDGTGVSPYDLQHGTMMANAGRDPLFWAVLSAEVSGAPDLTEEVEGTCMRCHTPLARAEALATDTEMLDAHDMRTSRGNLADLGRDGVSCTSCHRLEPTGLGAAETWSGQWVLESDDSVYGPHAEPFTNPMEHHTRYIPREGDHMLSSELCASCHTLQTPTVVDGAPSGHTYLEQATYLEWRNSDYATDGADPTACQGCHFPTTEPDGTEIETAIARNPGGSDFPIDERQPFGQHFQVGGNTLMLGILRDNADILNPRAGTGVFNAVIERSQRMLRTAGSLAIADFTSGTDSVHLTLTATNDTGHKLPSGYPARRAWIQLTVTDATGAVVARIGHTDDAGHILDDAGSPLASELAGGPTQPHRTHITSAEQVQVYQSLMADPAGTPVFRLLQAAQMHKDNRLLPRGWRSDTTATEVGDLAPVGVDGDADFQPGSDQVSVELTGLGGTGPYTVDAALVYQPVSPRYVAELSLVDTPEVTAFLAMAVGARWTPELIAEAHAE